jgi:hypothetical protein
MRLLHNLLLGFGALFLLGLILAVASLTRPNDSGGIGRDSYGVRGDGFRGVYELLEEVGVPVRRELYPFADDEQVEKDLTVVLIDPSPGFTARQPAYLEKLADWVRRGGRVVVAPPDRETRRRFNQSGPRDGDVIDADLMESLGLGGVEVAGDYGQGLLPADESALPPDTLDLFTEWDGQRKTVSLAVPAGSRVWIEGVERKLDPVLGYTVAEQVDGQAPATPPGAAFAARFPLGKGEVVVVAEPTLFSNSLLGLQDNSVAAVRLLSPEGGPVAIDEHFHGLSIRGNSLYVLTRPGFAAIAVGVVAAAAVGAWRTSVSLGPPVETAAKPRRDLREYVEAMGRLLTRGTDSRAFLLGEVRQGTLEELGRRLRLPSLTPSPAAVAAAIARRDRPRAERFTAAIDAIDQRLASRRRLGAKETTQLMNEVTRCL